jgi:hypothetical protein
MENHELDPQTQVVPLARLRALQADFDKLAGERDRLSAALVVSEIEVEELRQERDELRDAMTALETVSARLAAEKRDLQLQRDELLRAVRSALAWNLPRNHGAVEKFLAVLGYCQDWSAEDRARDAEERARDAGSAISLTCRICGEPLEEYEPTCARCDRDEPDIDDPDLMSKIREIPY